MSGGYEKTQQGRVVADPVAGAEGARRDEVRANAGATAVGLSPGR